MDNTDHLGKKLPTDDFVAMSGCSGNGEFAETHAKLVDAAWGPSTDGDLRLVQAEQTDAEKALLVAGSILIRKTLDEVNAPGIGLMLNLQFQQGGMKRLDNFIAEVNKDLTDEAAPLQLERLNPDDPSENQMLEAGKAFGRRLHQDTRAGVRLIDKVGNQQGTVIAIEGAGESI
jgi:hypothetical protein